MTTHLYCVLPGETRGEIPAGLGGLEGERVRALRIDGLVAWVSDVAPGLPVSIDGVRAHDTVVDAALATGATPVPARFGQRFPDDDACRAALARRAAPIASLLASMQGFVEMTLLITPSTRRMLRDLEPVIPEMFDPETGGSGRRYLETLREREAATGAIKRATEELARQLGVAVEALVHRSAVLQTGTQMPLRTISHLLARTNVDGYKEAVAAVRGGREVSCLVIGPRAPYSFSSLSDSGGAHGMNLAD